MKLWWQSEGAWRIHLPENFIERNIATVNKRAIENFIKAGALDCLEGNRRQKMIVFGQIVDDISRNKKQSMAGQLSSLTLCQRTRRRILRSVCRMRKNLTRIRFLALKKRFLNLS